LHVYCAEYSSAASGGTHEHAPPLKHWRFRPQLHVYVFATGVHTPPFPPHGWLEHCVWRHVSPLNPGGHAHA
jgi:hypothetical protein